MSTFAGVGVMTKESQMTEVHHGLEGVVAFETEIAEPDKEGSALRYRGVDIEDIVGHVPVRERLGPAGRRHLRARPAAGRAVPDPGALRRHPRRRAGGDRDARADAGACKPTYDIDDEQAREDLAGPR